MTKNPGRFGMIALVSLLGGGLAAQPRPVFHVDVNMVVLTFNVTDDHDHYVTGLKADDFQVLEDGIPEQTAIFAAGTQVPVHTSSVAAAPAGTSVFILFDTSNRMYQTYAHACDAVSDFVRHLDPADSVAIYNFSRNLWRAAPLTRNHTRARDDMANMVAGDETAVYDALLMTLRDAAKVPGRKVVVLFSNGPDTASMLTPSDIAMVAEDEGVPIYIVSTSEANRDKLTQHAFTALADATGGKLYTAQNWHKQADAFVAIRQDIGSSYTLGYYPAPNPNSGFRHIELRIRSANGENYHVRMRAGYAAGPHAGEITK